MIFFATAATKTASQTDPLLMFVVAMAAVMITSVLALLRAVLGPTVYDRILAVNMFGTVTVLTIAVIGFLTKRPEFLDLGLIYTLMNFIGIIAILKFTAYGDLAKADKTKTKKV